MMLDMRGHPVLLTIDTSALKHREEIQSAMSGVHHRIGFTHTTVR